MHRLVARLAGVRLQHILIVGFVLTAAITIAVGTPITYRLIRNYLQEAQDERVGRDMDLAEAFYNNKLDDISATARRIAFTRCVQHNIAAAGQGDAPAITAIDQEIENEIYSLPAGAQRFIIVTDAGGRSVVGRVMSHHELGYVLPDSDWSGLPIVASVLGQGRAQAAAEVIPGGVLAWVGLDEQARISLLDTAKAAPQRFDPREGTAGLALVSVAPIVAEEGDLIGTVLVGHLFNNDFTLVDRIQEVAGVDTVTIFFGDLRVSTNVLTESGERAIGTRVSQEVFDQVLRQGQEFTGEAFVVNQNYLTRYRPLYNHRGEVVGSLYVGAKQAAFQSLVDSFRRQVFLIAGASSLLAMLLAIPLAVSISRPLTALAGATRQVAEGDWSVRVPVDGYQEMRTLAVSFNTMVGTLRETQEQLVQKEKLASVGQLAAGVAHEINNPLGSILLYADILRKETPAEDEQQRADLEMILSEATRCKVIVNDLLNFSRQNEILAQATDLNAILHELAVEVGRQESASGVGIVEELDPDLPRIQADPQQLHQVFVNLMNNAVDAMPDGGTLTLRTRRGPDPGWVRVEVADTGAGIAPENTKKLFTPFFTTKPIGKGTGLGLAIIYGIVKMHRGQIGVQSEVGQGTTFTLTLQEKLPTGGKAPDGGSVLR